jgi:hypothetical protein
MAVEVSTPTADELPTVSVVDVSKAVSGSDSTGNSGDCVLRTTTGAGLDRRWEVVVDTEVQDATLVNASPITSTLLGTLLSKAGNGGIGEVLYSDGNATGKLFLPTLALTGQTVYSVADFQAGTYGKALKDAIATMISDGGDQEYYSTLDNGTETYTRNAACWAKEMDFSGVPVRSMASDPDRCAVPITKRHLIGARHWPVGSIGDEVWFAEADGTVHKKTIIGRVYQTAADSSLSDREVYLIDSDLPDEIAVYPVLGDVSSLFSAPAEDTTFHGVLVVWMNKSRHVGLRHWRAAALPTKVEVTPVFRGVSYSARDAFLPLGQATESRLEWSSDTYDLSPAGGDSGHPAFLWDGNDLIYLTSWYFTGQGPSAYGNYDILNAMIAAADSDAGISTGYTATVKTPEGYTTF